MVDESVDKCGFSGDKIGSYTHLLENFGLFTWFNGWTLNKCMQTREGEDAHVQDSRYREVQRFEDLRDIYTAALNRLSGDVPVVGVVSDQNVFATHEAMNHHDDVYGLIARLVSENNPRIRALDLFAGGQAGKRRFEHEAPGSVMTSVDILPGRTDVSFDVRELDRYFDRGQEFSAIFLIGMVPGSINHAQIKKILNDTGIVVTGGSKDIFDNHEARMLNGEVLDESDRFDAENLRMSEYFEPIMAIRVNDVKGYYADFLKGKGIKPTLDFGYVLWRKRQ